MFDILGGGSLSPKLVGPIGILSAGVGGFPRYAAPVPDEVLARAIECARKDICALSSAQRQLVLPPTRGTQTGGVPYRDFMATDAFHAQLTTLPAASVPAIASRGVFRYDAALRTQLVVDALASRLKVSRRVKPALVEHDGYSHPLLKIAAPSAPMIQAELATVLAAAQYRDARRDEILSQVDAAPVFFAALRGIRSTTHPNTIELMSVVARLVGYVLHPIKDALAIPRPDQLAGEPAMPQIETPSHFSFPGGHAAFGFAQTVMLALLMKQTSLDDLKRLGRLAWLIADNRVVAGLHYPMDGDAGCLVGVVLGLWLLFLATDDDAFLWGVEYAVVSDQGIVSWTKLARPATSPCPEWSEMVVSARTEWA